MNFKKYIKIMMIALSLSQSSCSNYIDNKKLFKQFYANSVQSNYFDIRYFIHKNYSYPNTVNIYIEGDGRAWINRNKISSDPTPTNHIVLKMVEQDMNNGIYIARPCQYLSNSEVVNCSSKYWTSHRFSKEVIDSLDDVINHLKEKKKFKKINLIGYSGGATIAFFIAQKRNDVVKFISVAGNINHKQWTGYHNITPLNGSFNPAEFGSNIRNIEYVFFHGSLDAVIPLEIINNYITKHKRNYNFKVIVFDGYDHSCCWASNWIKLLYENIENKDDA